MNSPISTGLPETSAKRLMFSGSGMKSRGVDVDAENVEDPAHLHPAVVRVLGKADAEDQVIRIMPAQRARDDLEILLGAGVEEVILDPLFLAGIRLQQLLEPGFRRRRLGISQQHVRPGHQ